MSEFLRKFKEKHSLRFHMFLIVSASFSCGILLNYILLLCSINQIWLRLLASIPFSYVMLFLFTKFWMIIISPDKESNSQSSVVDHIDGDLIPSSLNVDGIVIPVVKTSDASWEGSGGSFSGGGASSSWGIPDVDLDIDADSDSAPLILLVLLGIILLMLFGSVFYLLYISPQMLAEIALENAISIGIIKGIKKSTTPWYEMLLKKTIIPFVLILTISVGTTYAIQSHLPHIQKISDLKLSDFKSKTK